MSDQGDTMTLPVLDDDQVDEVVKAAVGVVYRTSEAWKRLRAAFPAPTPPAPKWERDTAGTMHEVAVKCGGDRSWVLLNVREHRNPRDAQAGLLPVEARAMAAALIACADWIDTHGPSADHGPVEAQTKGSVSG